jgi:hypothetical protein
VFVIESTSGGNISATWDNNGLNFSGVRLRATLGSLFNSQTITLPNFSIPFNGGLSLPVSPPNLRIAGFNCSSISFTLRRDASGIWIDPIGVNLAIPNFSHRLPNGYITGGGSVVLDFNGSLTLGGASGFTAANGRLQLRSTGLTGSGNFDLTAASHSFNSSFGFSGSVSPLGSYAWTGAGTLNFGGADTANSTFTYSNSGVGGLPGVSGTTTWSFGAESVSGSLGLNSSGISYNFSAGTDSGWQFVNIPGTFGRLTGNLSVSNSNGQGDAQGSIGGDLYGWNENFQGPKPTASNWASQVPACEHVGAGGSISSDGTIAASLGDICGFGNPFHFHGFSFTFDLW